MNRTFFSVFILILLLFGIFLVSSSLNEKDKVRVEVYEGLEKVDEVRVVVELKEPDGEKGFFIKTQKSEEEIEIEKQEIKEEVIKEVGEENIMHDFGQEFSLDISKKELDNLKTNENIELIKAPKKIYAFLQDSVPYINASIVWPINSTGQNTTGINETICILDTGINFTHPDLVGKNKTCVINCVTESCVANCSIHDDNGHGTHVAGITAASGSINGVAIGANLIGVKVLDSTGSGNGDDLNAGIDWCIANRIAYNISVISMSLGDCTNHATYCNADSSAPYINNATLYNISVIVASGNGPGLSCPSVTNTDGPASPACVQNATAIGAINDADESISYQRGELFQLMAPGITINSTFSGGSCLSGCSCSGNYMSCSGTSMSAPHAAGAFALFRQFFRLQKNRAPTPSEIKTIFNSTGKQINDTSGTNLNYPIIDVYAAVDSLRVPIVTKISPSNNSYLNLSNQNSTFTCNTSSNYDLANITFSLWNASLLVYNLTENITGITNQTNFSYNFSIEDSYLWNCLAYNNNSFLNSDPNYTITYDTTYPQVNLISPANSSSWTSSSTVSFTYNVSDVSIANCSLIINNAVDQTNSSITINETMIFTKSLSNANYNWSVNCTDSANHMNNSKQRELTVSYTAPVVQNNGGGGGGGGGTSSMTYVTSLSQTVSGYTKSLEKDDKIKFTVFDSENTQHTMTLNSIGVDSVNLTIRSNPITILLGVGQSAKLNLTSADYYDLYIKLNSIANNKADLTIQTVNEKIIKQADITGKVVEETNKIEEKEEISSRDLGQTFIYAIVLIFIVIGTIILLRKKSHKKIKSSVKKEYKERFHKHINPK